MINRQNRLKQTRTDKTDSHVSLVTAYLFLYNRVLSLVTPPLGKNNYCIHLYTVKKCNSNESCTLPRCPSYGLSRVTSPLSAEWRNEAARLLFTLLCQQKLFTQNRRFSSYLHQTPEALLACPAIARRATADEDVPHTLHL